mmetsp:Transcript_134/g.399  ORF Transcript_134/g.399 Transcript_134/m.399 type:complete len:574 (+) Transcript_134:143-1864(+)
MIVRRLSRVGVETSRELLGRRRWTGLDSVARGRRGTYRLQTSEEVNLGILSRELTGSIEHDLRPSTKVVCTIGPVSESEEMIRKMVASGMTCMRINCSHATFEEQRNRIERLRKAVEEEGADNPVVPVPVLLDIKGPSIRTGFLDGPLKGKNKVQLETGSRLTIRTDADYDNFRGSTEEICVSYAGLHKELAEGNTILIDDGVIELKVLSTGKGIIETEVLVGGVLGEKKGLNLPGISTAVEFMTDKDKKDMEHAVKTLGVDFVAASFVRSPEVIRAFRKFLDENCGKRGKEVGIVAKIENDDGLSNYNQILEEVQGIMVARGDLGVEIPTHKLFLMQKLMIQRANEAGKFVINCTQMLDSMMQNPRPTRAEALDVANAVLDGADATMLSGESAGGRFPEMSVQTMRDINFEADEAFAKQIVPTPAAGRRSKHSLQSAEASKAVDMAIRENASLIVVQPRDKGESDRVADLAHEIARARPWSQQVGTIGLVALGGHGNDFAAGASSHRQPGTTFRQLAMRRACYPLRPPSGKMRDWSPEEVLELVRSARVAPLHLPVRLCIVRPDEFPKLVDG